MNKGQIVKLKDNIAFSNYHKGDLGIIVNINPDTSKLNVLFFNGATKEIPESLLSATRNIPITVKNCFKDILQLYKKIEKHNVIIADHKKDINILNKEILSKAIDLNKLIHENSNEYTNQEILDLCKLNFHDLEENDFDFDLYNKKLYISKTETIQKYFRNSSFTYEEYDGTIQFISDCRKNTDYKKYIQRYNSKVDFCKLPCEVFLTLGDKDTLICNTEYVIDFKTYNKDIVNKTISKYIDGPLKELENEELER